MEGRSTGRLILYGPPGTGKTMFAKAIAKESGAVFINSRISNLMSKWFSNAQKLGQLIPACCIYMCAMRMMMLYYYVSMAAVFSLAHKLQPVMISIDEVDSFLGKRRTTDHDAMTNMKTEFMSLWDGFTTDRIVSIASRRYAYAVFNQLKHRAGKPKIRDHLITRHEQTFKYQKYVDKMKRWDH